MNYDRASARRGELIGLTQPLSPGRQCALMVLVACVQQGVDGRCVYEDDRALYVSAR